MIFSVRRSQYCIFRSKSQRLFVTRHRLSCEKVNLHNKRTRIKRELGTPVIFIFTSYNTCFVSFRRIPIVSFRFVEYHKPRISSREFEKLLFFNVSKEKRVKIKSGKL